MKQGVLYGVGVGPGDPELMTVKAVRIIREADVVAVPDGQTAQNIAADYLEGKEILPCSMPMLRDKALLAQKHGEAAERICALLEQGKTVAFLTLGDPSVYSTYMYVHRRVLARGYEAQLVPGVPSFCAVAARLGDSLCEGAEPLMIVPASYRNADACLDFPGNKVFMKAGRSMGDLRDKLRARGDSAQMVENCGMQNERVFRSLDEIDPDAGYFSVVLVRHGKDKQI